MPDHPLAEVFGDPIDNNHGVPVKPVNIASVPHRSPFRYAGGKTWLVPQVRQWLRAQPTRPRVLIEPFAGGGTVSLTAVCENLVERAIMVELDADVASVWQTILNGGADWLADRVMSFDICPERVMEELARDALSTHERAFQTLLRNRVLHGGILAPGSGFIKHGENGKGLKSRWYPSTLRRRIVQIKLVSERLTFVQGDGLTALRDSSPPSDAVYFIDPPYTAPGKAAGRRLYLHNELDHEELFRVAAGLTGDFLMTYDYAESVIAMASRHGFATRPIAMNNTHHAHVTELLVGRNLSWLDG